MERLLNNPNPVACLIPPHMVEALKLRGDARQQKMATELEKTAEAYRVERLTSEPPDSYMAAAVHGDVSALLPRRHIHDGGTKSALPGRSLRKEGDGASGDSAVDDAYDFSGAVHALYADVFGRDSLDGNGLEMVSTVHHRNKYNNAFWDGNQMAYGDGDGVLFKTFIVRSVVGHELSHGVVQFSGGLIYRDQPGALNESFADVFGCLAEQYALGQPVHESSWLVGEGILGPNISGTALRSMRAPGTAYEDPVLGKDPQPYHMSGYVQTSSDNGGVHINSGIPNQAFYLLASFLGGNAWERAGQIWYDSLQSIRDPQATFQDWAEMTVIKATERYSFGSREHIFTRRAWKLVGIET